ncbi:MAG: SurA N-terminal domain-containing protein [Deltaproteobacteria bacterium]|nr:SurA N-terminal domain-containing protein [Deltaproteobacteria bacterium]
MKKIFCTLCAGLFLFSGGGQTVAEEVSRIAAVVIDEPITTFQLDQRFAELRAVQNERITRREALNMLIEDILVEKKAKEMKIEVSDDDIAAARRDVEQSNNLNTDQLYAALAKEGVSAEMFHANLRRQILRNRLVRYSGMRSNVRPSDREVNEYFREHREDFRRPSSFRLNTVGVTFLGAGSKEKAVSQMEKIRQRLLKGEDFSAVMASLKNTPGVSSEQLGKVATEDLHPMFAAALAEVKEGEPSQILVSPTEARMFYVVERGEAEYRKMDEVRPEIERILAGRKSQNVMGDMFKELREGARIEILLKDEG